MVETMCHTMALMKGTAMYDPPPQCRRSRTIRKNGNCPLDLLKLEKSKPYEITHKPISSSGVQLLKVSWKKLRISPGASTFCDGIVRRMMRGETEKLFRKLSVSAAYRRKGADLPPSFSPALLQEHLRLYMELIDAVVNSLDDLAATAKFLNEVGKRHQKHGGDFKSSYWDDFGQAVNETAQLWLRNGSRAPPLNGRRATKGSVERETARAWTSLASFMADQLRVGQLKFRRHSERQTPRSVSHTPSPSAVRKSSSTQNVRSGS